MPIEAISQLSGSVVEKQGTKAAFNDVQAAYDAGTPFFSKAALRDASSQLERYRKGNRDKTILRAVGVDGLEVEFLVDAVDRPHIRIWYRSLQSLTSEKSLWIIGPEQAYLAITFARFKKDHGHIDPRKDENAANVKDEAEFGEMPASDLRATFLDRMKEWKTEPFLDDMRRIWDVTITSVSIDRIIAFACGPLIWYHQYPTQSILQHALILSLRDYLLEKGEQGGKRCVCYAQDPAYSDRDKDVLGSFGIIPLEDAGGFLEADDNSIVLSFHPNVPVKQIIADLCRPAVIIWATRPATDRPVTDPHSTRVDDMLQKEYNEVALPYHVAFGSIIMYCKKTGVV